MTIKAPAAVSSIAGIQVREVESWEEFRACVLLQHEVVGAEGPTCAQ